MYTLPNIHYLCTVYLISNYQDTAVQGQANCAPTKLMLELSERGENMCYGKFPPSAP